MTDKNWKTPEIAHLAELHNAMRPGSLKHTAKDWDDRAEAWQKDLWHENMQGQQAQNRVAAAVNYLTAENALTSATKVIDVGCGPGQFVTAFAKKGKQAVGLDISPKIVKMGENYAESQGVVNANFLAADFLTLDLEKAGLKKAFDLAFCSITPAIRGTEGLKKFMELSSSWCCSSHFLRNSDDLFDKILADVFPDKETDRWNGKFFYTTLNLLLLNGFLPKTHYYTWQQEVWLTADAKLANKALGTLLNATEQTEENLQLVLDWLLSHANEEGKVLTKPTQTYGFILWDVSNKVR